MAAHTGNDIDVNFLQQILLYNNSKYLLRTTNVNSNI